MVLTPIAPTSQNRAMWYRKYVCVISSLERVEWSSEAKTRIGVNTCNQHLMTALQIIRWWRQHNEVWTPHLVSCLPGELGLGVRICWVQWPWEIWSCCGLQVSNPFTILNLLCYKLLKIHLHCMTKSWSVSLLSNLCCLQIARELQTQALLRGTTPAPVTFLIHYFRHNLL